MESDFIARRSQIIITVPHAGLHGSAESSDLAMVADGDVIAAATARRWYCVVESHAVM